MTRSEEIIINARYYRDVPPENPIGYVEEDLVLNRMETAFLLVDVYGLGFDPDLKYGKVDGFYKDLVTQCREIVINHIKPAKIAAKNVGLPIIYLTNYLAPSTTENNEWRNMSIRTCGIDVLEAWQEPNDVLAYSKIIAPEPDDYLIKKQHYSGFFETHLESLLKELDIKNLVMVGFDSLICLHSTALDALYRNYRVIVLRDCTATTEFLETKKEQWANWLAIRFIENNIGYTSTSSDFIHSCGNLSKI